MDQSGGEQGEVREARVMERREVSMREVHEESYSVYI